MAANLTIQGLGPIVEDLADMIQGAASDVKTTVNSTASDVSQVTPVIVQSLGSTVKVSIGRRATLTLTLRALPL